jgi:sortase A
VPKLHLEVPLLDGSDELSLNRGVGHIAGTAYPGETGNIGIAGHRDGFFRRLKDIQVGDLIDLETISRRDSYQVERILIVDPNDVSVLQPGQTRGLTLVTCYPFYFVGSAPQRYIVQASLARPRAVDVKMSQQSELEPEKRGRGKGTEVISFKPATQSIKPKVQTLKKEKIQ